MRGRHIRRTVASWPGWLAWGAFGALWLAASAVVYAVVAAWAL